MVGNGRNGGEAITGDRKGMEEEKRDLHPPNLRSPRSSRGCARDRCVLTALAWSLLEAGDRIASPVRSAYKLAAHVRASEQRRENGISQ